MHWFLLPLKETARFLNTHKINIRIFYPGLLGAWVIVQVTIFQLHNSTPPLLPGKSGATHSWLRIYQPLSKNSIPTIRRHIKP